jgi:CHAT domain-containing protein
MVTGEGLQSLARAFTAEGTGAVVAGWWNVNDATAAQLMQDFYRRWANEQDPQSIALSLRGSKLDWLNNPQVPYQHKLPYYWAALNYSGNPQPLKNSIAPGNAAYLWWMLAVLGTTGLFLLLRRTRR